MKTRFLDLEVGDVFVYKHIIDATDTYCMFIAVTNNVNILSGTFKFDELVELKGSSDYREGCAYDVRIDIHEDEYSTFKFQRFLHSSDYDDEEDITGEDYQLLKDDAIGRYPEYLI